MTVPISSIQTQATRQARLEYRSFNFSLAFWSLETSDKLCSLRRCGHSRRHSRQRTAKTGRRSESSKLQQSRTAHGLNWESWRTTDVSTQESSNNATSCTSWSTAPSFPKPTGVPSGQELVASWASTLWTYPQSRERTWTGDDRSLVRCAALRQELQNTTTAGQQSAPRRARPCQPRPMATTGRSVCTWAAVYLAPSSLCQHSRLTQIGHFFATSCVFPGVQHVKEKEEHLLSPGPRLCSRGRQRTGNRASLGPVPTQGWTWRRRRQAVLTAFLLAEDFLRAQPVRWSLFQSAASSGESSVPGGLALSTRNCSHWMRGPLHPRTCRLSLCSACEHSSSGECSSSRRFLTAPEPIDGFSWQPDTVPWFGSSDMAPGRTDNIYDSEPDLWKWDLGVAGNSCPRAPRPMLQPAAPVRPRLLLRELLLAHSPSNPRRSIRGSLTHQIR